MVGVGAGLRLDRQDTRTAQTVIAREEAPAISEVKFAELEALAQSSCQCSLMSDGDGASDC